MSYIAKFNPYNMDEATVLAVATARKALLHQVLKTLEDNLDTSSIAQHLLIRGPRGMGKSFFLKYLQIHFNKKEIFKDCDFLLLPEEQNNINSPTDLIKLILGELNGRDADDAISLWEEPENLWGQELENLKQFIETKRAKKENYQLVVVLENLDEFLHNIKKEKKTREVNESRFRHLLEKIKHLTIIGATPRIDSEGIDRNYNQRLFHAFKKCNLKRWQEADYYKYLDRRRAIREAQLGKTFSEEQLSLMRTKLKAISQYTGGSPRMAVVLTNLLLEDDVLSTVKTMMGLIDDLTPYYQDLTKSIPQKSKILFDTLIRKGENISQSELAEIVGATQSKISKAFLWLKDNGYIIGKKRSNSPAFSYHVQDRIHVLYYKLREVHHNKSITPIWLFSDFLVAFYQEQELREQAIKSLRTQPGQEANDLARLYLLTSVYKDISELPEFDKSEDWLGMVQDAPEKNERIKEIFETIESYLEYEKEEDFIELVKKEIDELTKLINYIANSHIQKQYLLKGIDFSRKLFFEKGFIDTSLIICEGLLPLFKKPQFSGEEYFSVLVLLIALNLHNDNNQAKKYFKKYILESEELLETATEINKNSKHIFASLEYQMTVCALTIYNLSDNLNIEEKNEYTSLLFKIGNRLLFSLRENKGIMSNLNKIYSEWFNVKMPYSLLQDLCEEALILFPEPENQLITHAALNSIKYLESGKDPAFLETLNPDMSIAVQAIMAEVKVEDQSVEG